MAEPSGDPRRAAIYRAVLLAVLADADRGVARQVVLARGVERLLMIGESDERPAERIQRENAAALHAMKERGNTRGAAMKVAKLFSKDPHTREILAQRFRRLRRAKTKRAVFG